METIALVNQKGGVAKTTTAVNLGIGLAKCGKAVLLLDLDPQGSMTSHLGYHPDEMETTTTTLLQKVVEDMPIGPGEGILHHREGVDLIPATAVWRMPASLQWKASGRRWNAMRCPWDMAASPATRTTAQAA